MLMQIEKAKIGCEPIVEAFDNAIAKINEAKEFELAETIKAISEKYDGRLANYIEDRKHYVDIETQEIPEPLIEQEEQEQKQEQKQETY